MITMNSDNQPLSNEFISKMNSDSRTFRARFLVEGSVLSCDILKISINKGAGKEVVPGAIYVPYFKAQIAKCNTVLDGKDITLQIGLLLEGTVEYLDFGTFTVVRENRALGKTEISAAGFLRSKCSGVISLSAGTSIAAALQSIQADTGLNIILKGLTATGSIQHLLSASCRDALGEIAALLGGFVTEDHSGNIVIAKYGSGDTLPVSGDRMLNPPEANNSDFEVTGLKVIVSEESTDEDGETIPEKSYVNGQANVIYKSENMTQEQFAVVVRNFVGYSFRPATAGLSLGDPRLEPWDSLEVSDPGGDEYTVPCLEMVFEYDGGLQVLVDAAVNTDAENETAVQGPYSKALDILTADMIAANDAIIKRATIGQLNAESAILSKAIIGTGSATDFTAARLAFTTACGRIFSADQVTALAAAFDTATAGTITADNIDAARAVFQNAIAGSFTAAEVVAASGEFRKAVVNQLYVDSLKAGYAEIDFANVTTEAVKNLFVNVGMIENATIHEGRITGTLSGVTVVADLIQANAIVTGDLIVQDENNEGTYYKINPAESGLTIDELEALEYEKFVSGQYIVARSITADQIAVTELAAFGATIAGLQLENGKIYSAGKSTVGSQAPGLYMDSQGQFVTGSDYNFIASWYDTEAQKWKIAIRADEISFGTGESITEVVESTAEDLAAMFTEADESILGNIESVEGDISTMQSAIDDTSAELDSINNAISETNINIESVNETIQEQEGKIDDVNDRIDESNGKIETIRNEISNNTNAISGIYKCIIIRPDDPSVAVQLSNEDQSEIFGQIKLSVDTDPNYNNTGLINISGSSNTVSWFDNQSMYSNTIYATSIMPRYIEENAGRADVQLTGGLTILARSNGHLSIKPVQ